jgi:branched-chain amino acid transport system ATP-binding protein
MLDEPSLGLAPMAIARVYDKLTAIRSRGVAILVAEQNAARAFAVADRVLIMSHGRFSLSGHPDEVRAHRDFDGAYFGVTMSGASGSR